MTTVLAGGLTALLLVQLGLAIVQRLHPHLLWLHMLVGLALVTPLGVHVGIRTWLDGERAEPGGRLGPLLLAALACQLLLGVAAWGVTAPPALALLLVTLHFWLGPLLLALVLASY